MQQREAARQAERRGQPAQAIETWREVARAHPEDAEAWQALLRLHQEAGHASQADAQAALARLRDGKGLRALRLVTVQAPRRELFLRSADWPQAQAQASASEWPGTPRACAPELSRLPEAADSPASAASAAAGR